jgi:hypothetical protein
MKLNIISLVSRFEITFVDKKTKNRKRNSKNKESQKS